MKTKGEPVWDDDPALNDAIACPSELVVYDNFGQVQKTLVVQRWAPVVESGKPVEVEIKALITMPKP